MQISSKPNYPRNRTKGLVRQKRKISDAEADEIRRCYVHGHKRFGLKSLAEKYGVSAIAIWKIVREKSHVPKNWADRPRSKEPRNAKWKAFNDGEFTQCSEAEIWEMCQQLANEVAEEMGLIDKR